MWANVGVVEIALMVAANQVLLCRVMVFTERHL